MLSGRKRKIRIGSRCDSAENFPESSGHFRIWMLALGIIIATGAIIFRLYSLQVVAYEDYRLLAEGQHTLFSKLIPKRGEIFFQDKDKPYPAAVNQETKLAYAVPKEIENREETAKFISATLGLDEKILLEKFSNPEDQYEPLKHRLTDEEIQKIEDQKLAGIHLADETYRYYPSGELAANLLGFVGWNGDELLGRYGIEGYFDKDLKGEIGNLESNRDTLGRWISVGKRLLTPAKDGTGVVLTIDHIIQYEAERILKGAMEKFQAENGLIIVMEPETGKILAMAQAPGFDPNQYGEVADASVFRNLSVSSPYECGSVFKTITLASAIDAGKINPDTTYNDTGLVQEAGYGIKNSDEKAYGKQTMTQVLEKSLNTGAIFAEKQLGNRGFYDYVTRFGFGETTGVEIAGESAGSIANLKNLKSAIQFFTASFGQGITITPIQLVSAFASIANGGVLMKPQITEKVIYSDGQEQTVNPQEIRRVISPETAVKISEMLRSVVVNGHGKRADVPGYQVAGKTGTAQVASTTSQGYETGKSIGSFAGFAPLDNPKFAVLVKMENPKTVQWAESSAAPTFGELMKFLLEYADIEPTEKYTQKDLEIFNQTHDLKEIYLKKQQIEREKQKKLEEQQKINEQK
ncbi:MAG: penicillin-binding protein 2 [Candidatus Moranbacteria bacterium]|nr:penicillin-binding protein 2 [Candidatus Moranbacteria bacterium]